MSEKQSENEVFKILFFQTAAYLARSESRARRAKNKAKTTKTAKGGG
ncbi:MAG: hypothetical protein SPH89_07405 [Candidatus Limisoma sp.]|nr:hypothetical protein [Candidatus Limisoma sp.]